MINTPLSRDADAEWAARSRGNLTSSGAGGNTPTRNVLYPFCRARTSTREMKGKVGSGAHCPGLPTVDYSTTSPGGDSRSASNLSRARLHSEGRVGVGVQCCGLARWRARERARARVVRVARVWTSELACPDAGGEGGVPGMRGRCRRVPASTCAGAWLASGWHVRVTRAWLACG